MKLYYAPGTCALACWISLEWAGADYEVEKVNYVSEEYKKINPLGMVPALYLGGERAMTQAGAILKYIAEKYPNANLGADDAELAKFEFNETMAFLTGDFHPAFWPMFVPSRYTTSKSMKELENVQEASYDRIDRVMSHLDKLILENNGHVYKCRRTVADAYAFVMASWSVKAKKTWQDYPNLKSFMEKMKEDEAVKKVLELSNQK